MPVLRTPTLPALGPCLLGCAAEQAPGGGYLGRGRSRTMPYQQSGVQTSAPRARA